MTLNGNQEVGDHGLCEINTWYLSAETEETMKQPSHDIRYSGPGPNRMPRE
jgi:hypothetical protein